MSRRPRISVIITLHDHGCVDKLLESLTNQTVPRSEFEVLIVDAEHALDWEPTIRKIAGAAADLDVRYIKIAKGGRAAERNRGVIESRADLVLFLADDFDPSLGLVEEHLKSHEKYLMSNVAVLGPVVYPSDVLVTPFMCWLEESGNLWGVSFMRKDATVPADFFYGANVSLKKELLLSAGSFDEDLPHHVYDDLEMGRRLFRLGMKTVFVPSALAYHRDPATLKERAKIMREAGESAAILDTKNLKAPGMHRLDKSFPGLVALLSRLKLRNFGRLSFRGLYYGWVLARAFTQGYNEHFKQYR